MKEEMPDVIKKQEEPTNPLKLLKIVTYGTHHQRIIGEVDQAYEELKQSLNRLKMFEKLFCKLDFKLGVAPADCDDDGTLWDDFVFYTAGSKSKFDDLLVTDGETVRLISKLKNNITTIPLDAVDDTDTMIDKTLEDLGYVIWFKDDTHIIYFETNVSVYLNTDGDSNYFRNSEIIQFVKIYNNTTWCYQTQSKMTFDAELAAACLNKLHELNTKTK